jgi:hypothetical protein
MQTMMPICVSVMRRGTPSTAKTAASSTPALVIPPTVDARRGCR